MGYGGYSHDAHVAITRSRQHVPREQVFTQTHCHPLMNPHGVQLREARDSADHPSSLGIVFALDVTGSMGKIPEQLARRTLPTFMKSLQDSGIADPQILFLAVGDATSDRAPLQVGQFESTAQQIDQWLTWSYLEGGGGGQGTESYELAMYFAARHTAMDCLQLRGRRGYFFMTGDELPYPAVSRQQVRELIGESLEQDLPLDALVAELQRSYQPFFLIPDPQRRERIERTWRDLLGDRVICLQEPEDTCQVAAGLVALGEGAVSTLAELAEQLKAAGLPRRKIAAVVQALGPFAASLGRDGVPEPALGEARLPGGDGPSGHTRL